jgi:hypothetical protein
MAGVSQNGGDEGYSRAGRAAERDRGSRLLRAIEELRDLERQKHSASPSTEPFQDLARRLELKAREVFEMAAEEREDLPDPADEAGPPGLRH